MSLDSVEVACACVLGVPCVGIGIVPGSVQTVQQPPGREERGNIPSQHSDSYQPGHTGGA